MRKLLVATSGVAAGAAVLAAAALAQPAKHGHVALTIQHVQKGCHVWSNGKMTTPTMHMRLHTGDTLRIVDMDVDAHQMMQLGGPVKMHMGGPMMMNGAMTLRFSKKGTYTFRTRVVEMKGAMEVETKGPDHKLRLVVVVT